MLHRSFASAMAYGYFVTLFTCTGLSMRYLIIKQTNQPKRDINNSYFAKRMKSVY